MHRSVRQFLDVEAREEDGDDSLDSEEEESNDPFLDDGLEPDNYPSGHLSSIELPDIREKTLDRLIEKILSNTHTGRTTSRFHDAYEEENLTVGNVIRLPREGDFPLWRVKCRTGTEEIAVLSLLGTAGPSHQLRSAFTCGSVRGSIYLECTMNTELVNLLRITPGVVRSHQGVRRWMVDPAEQVDLLKMRSDQGEVEVGDWVLVKKGLYKGDAGVVSSVHSWGACVLLVPRLDATPLPSDLPAPPNRKRKATITRPVAQLFDFEAFQPSTSVQITRMGENSHSMGILRFEHGLVSQELDFHSFQKDLKDIPLDHHLLFVRSRHPRVVLSHMPRPREWFFKEKDQVVLLSTGKTGIIKSLEMYYAEIECSEPTQSTLTWTERVPWNNIQRDVKVGQYIRTNGGPHAGMSGWVVGVNAGFASIASKVLEGQIFEHDHALNFANVLVNCSEITEPPFTYQTQQPAQLHGPDEAPEIPNPLTQRALRHPWCGLNVKISRKHHPKKGETGVIKEVSGRGGTDIKLTLQLTRYNPSAPFHTVTVDYRDVVELKSSKELVVFLDPGRGFCRPDFRPETKTEKKESSSQHVDVEHVTGGQTPLPSRAEVDTSGSAAWDPSSRTPGPWDDLIRSLTQGGPSKSTEGLQCNIRESNHNSHSPPSPGPQSHASSSTSILPCPPKLNHVLLNPRLVGLAFNVIVNGGGFSGKELVASLTSDGESAPTLRYTRYRTTIFLHPDWVTPKHPNPTHDNGLLIVIKGEHCGKYVRRIHHHRENGSLSIIVAVVTRSDGTPDVLTGEHLEFSVDFLCTVTETKKQKDLNWNVMQKCREQFRNSHR